MGERSGWVESDRGARTGAKDRPWRLNGWATKVIRGGCLAVPSRCPGATAPTPERAQTTGYLAGWPLSVLATPWLSPSASAGGSSPRPPNTPIREGTLSESARPDGTTMSEPRLTMLS